MSDLIKGTKLNNFVKTMAPDSHCRHKLALDAARALQYLHAQRPSIMHGDLKPDNVMIELRTSSPCPKLVDFGLARLQTKHSKHMGGTTRWAAPEVRFNRDRPAPSADVYSFGLLVHFIMTGLQPRDRLYSSDGKELAASQLLDQLCRWPANMVLREECRTLCAKCLMWDAAMRPEIDAVQCLLSTWLSTADHGNVSSAAADKPSWSEQLQRLRAYVPRLHTHQPKGEASADSEQLAPHEAHGSLQYPNLRSTSIAAQEATLVIAASRYNFQLGTPTCCAWHAMMGHLRWLVLRLEGQKCRPLRDWTAHQCPDCGLLMTRTEPQCGYCCKPIANSKVQL
eukprot:gnl/TRDRNA2_/TRDRNA2_174500_c0_seq7.p1 gnl/TRDRNA2_/TRDRNA2_174500_c0~~gnl/TRDRNA2_/TRDRNA2_174500_c0_seq7.p1  ORF type:complete len:347 (+),score=35.73 gnl/TRDRNA2_/TRDRNA2_174500_c0_seq7:26-1042(+)